MFRRQNPSGERSADERVRAAAERAARRAAREGRPVEPPPPETFGGARTGNGAPAGAEPAWPELDDPGVEPYSVPDHLRYDPAAAPAGDRYDLPPDDPHAEPYRGPYHADDIAHGPATGAYDVPSTDDPPPPATRAFRPASHEPPAAEEPPTRPFRPATEEPQPAEGEPAAPELRPAEGLDHAGGRPAEGLDDAGGRPAEGLDDAGGRPEEGGPAAPEPPTRAFEPAAQDPALEDTPHQPSPYEPQHYTAPPADAGGRDPEPAVEADEMAAHPTDSTLHGATEQWDVPDTLGPEERTAEWSMPPAPDPPPPPPARAQPAVPLRSQAGVPPRGRWRPERGRDRLAPTRPLATAGDVDPSKPAGSGGGRRRALALLSVVLVAVAALFIVLVFQPFHGDGRGAVRVTVPAGADAGQIGDILADRGVVRSGRFFTINATVTGRRGGMRPGNYTLPRDMSYGAAIDALSKGPKARVVKTFNLTIPEGRSARETAQKMKDVESIEGDYLRATRNAGLLRRARRLGLPRNARTLEGFLFPATYTLPEGTTATELVGRQLSGYADNTAEVSFARARRAKLTRYDVAIIASMIEREVQLDRERPLVAAVIYNRLKQGIPLGIDATIRYETNNWTRPIRQSELERDTPFNTRLRRGLPPTPIGNAGLASIRAAVRPANVDYLYYVVKPGSKGAHAFSSSDAEFQRDVARYQRAREAQGGQAP